MRFSFTDTDCSQDSRGRKWIALISLYHFHKYIKMRHLFIWDVGQRCLITRLLIDEIYTSLEISIGLRIITLCSLMDRQMYWLVDSHLDRLLFLWQSRDCPRKTHPLTTPNKYRSGKYTLRKRNILFWSLDSQTCKKWTINFLNQI